MKLQGHIRAVKNMKFTGHIKGKSERGVCEPSTCPSCANGWQERDGKKIDVNESHKG